MISLGDLAKTLRANFTGCTFDGSPSGPIQDAIVYEKAGTLSVGGGVMTDFVHPIHVNDADVVTIDGLMTRNVNGTYSVVFRASYAGRTSISDNFEKAPERRPLTRPYAMAIGFPTSIAAAGTDITYGTKVVDTAGVAQ